MRRVTRGRERGAVAVIMAVLLAGGVIMAALAVSVDVGNVMYERRQLQNAADASSLALAQSCAKDPTCSSGALSDAQVLAAKNGADGAMELAPTDVCGSFPLNESLKVEKCTSVGSITDLKDCTLKPDWLKAGIPYVETRPRTLSATGEPILPTFFSRMVAGGSDGGGYTACARAAWGAPKSYSGSIPLTFSACEWDNFTHEADFVWPTPPGGSVPGYGGSGDPDWPSIGYEKVIKFQDGDHSAPCTYSNGKDGPGGFGDVQPLNKTCSRTVQTGGWLLGDNGKSVDVDCRPALAALRGKAVLVPVFDCLYITNSVYTGAKPDDSLCQGKTKDTKGGTYNYHIKGWARFYLSGYSFPSMSQNSYISGSAPCGNNESCISGWFLTGQLQADAIIEPGGDTDFGTYAVLPAG